jgi:hypothetical protein
MWNDADADGIALMLLHTHCNNADLQLPAIPYNSRIYPYYINALLMLTDE